MNLGKFLNRWRAWARGLKVLALCARSVSLRIEPVLIVTFAEDTDITELRSYLPGWNVAWVNDTEIRCVPPAYGDVRPS